MRIGVLHTHHLDSCVLFASGRISLYLWSPVTLLTRTARPLKSTAFGLAWAKSLDPISGTTRRYLGWMRTQISFFLGDDHRDVLGQADPVRANWVFMIPLPGTVSLHQPPILNSRPVRRGPGNTPAVLGSALIAFFSPLGTGRQYWRVSSRSLTF